MISKGRSELEIYFDAIQLKNRYHLLINVKQAPEFMNGMSCATYYCRKISSSGN